MCLIIQRPAKVELDFEKFKTAVMNNPHGYGLAVPDGNGNLITIRDHNKPDAEDLYKFIHEEFKDQRVMVHLRYTTAGATNLRNAHPFPILEKSVDGVDLRMAHNGTLPAYKGNTSESDTRRFVKQYVRPLFKRLRKGMDIEDILTDPFIHKLLDDKLTSASVLTFIDGNGNTLEVNAKGNGGMYLDNGVYYSNTYSFNKTHREPYNYAKAYGGYQSWRDDSFWQDDDDYTTTKPFAKEQQKTLPALVTKKEVPEHAMDTKVKKFSEEYDIEPHYFSEMTDDFIESLVENEPEGAKLLIKELLFELEINTTMETIN